MTTFYLGRHLPAMGFELRLGSSRRVDRPLYTYRFEPSSSHLLSTQTNNFGNKFMSCTQLMFTSNILHVEDNLLQYYLYGKKVTVVGFEPGFESVRFRPV